MPSSNNHTPASSVRTRFAPSPTGFLHVGGIRTALFAYLVAKQANGKFVLRLEDTDQKREVAGSKEHLISSLKAIGITYDEGPDIGGPYGPYTQSERLEHYRRWAQKLIDAGLAYADPYTSEEVQKFREEATANKKAFLYRHHRPENLPMWDGTQPLRIRRITSLTSSMTPRWRSLTSSVDKNLSQVCPISSRSTRPWKSHDQYSLICLIF